MYIFRQEITNSSGISLYNKAHVSYESKTTQLNVEPFHNTTTHTRQRSLKSMDHWIKWIREHVGSVPIYSCMTTISRLTFLFDKTRKIERGIEKKIIIATCHQSRDSRGHRSIIRLRSDVRVPMGSRVKVRQYGSTRKKML